MCWGPGKRSCPCVPFYTYFRPERIKRGDGDVTGMPRSPLRRQSGIWPYILFKGRSTKSQKSVDNTTYDIWTTKKCGKWPRSRPPLMNRSEYFSNKKNPTLWSSLKVPGLFLARFRQNSLSNQHKESWLSSICPTLSWMNHWRWRSIFS